MTAANLFTTADRNPFQARALAAEFEALSQLELSRTLDHTTLRQIAAHLSVHQIARREAVYRAGDDRNAIFGLVSGHVKIMREDKPGDQVLLDILPPGTIFGEDALFASGKRERTVVAHEMSVVVYIAKNDFLRLLNEFPKLHDYVFRTVGERLLRAESRICDLSMDGIARRLAKVLLDLGAHYGTPQEGGRMLISLRIPHRELADLVGSTRESVTMHLNELRRRQIIEFTNRRILILDPAALTEQL